MHVHYLATLSMLLWAVSCLSAQVEIYDIRTKPHRDHTRVVFDLSAPAEHTLFSLQRPDRIVIDLRNARLNARLSLPAPAGKRLRRVRAAPRDSRDVRVVLDVEQTLRPKSFLLSPGAQYGHRLVIDLYEKQGSHNNGVKTLETRATPSTLLRDVVIAIDPGHGGKDPGAVGRGGTLEKDITLSVSRHLQALIREARGMNPIIVRKGDHYLTLRERIEVARKHKADLFVSIHADAFRDPNIAGSSVYVLSRNGASSEAAQWLANRENAADLVGGVSIHDKDEILASVLLDLSQSATLSASMEVGAEVLKELTTMIGTPHKRRVQQAGFVVLKSPDIPSILIETGFISNPSEERKLRNVAHQRTLARAILRGLRSYFSQHPPPNTLLAAREHVIERGDTLSEIALHYGVSLKRLREVNNLPSDRLHVGAILRIPPGSHGT